MPVDHLVILTDDSPNWRPRRYEVAKARSRLTLEFDAVKVLDWAGREEELLAHPNLAALFVQAHLWSRQTQGDDPARLERKLTLIRELLRRTLDGEELRHWYRYLDWLLDLPPELNQRVDEAIDQIEQEGKMAFITSMERRGIEKGREEMRKELQEEFQRLEQEKALIERQRSEQGERDTLLLAIRTVCAIKFNDREALTTELYGKPVDQFRRALQGMETATTLDEVRASLGQD